MAVSTAPRCRCRRPISNRFWFINKLRFLCWWILNAQYLPHIHTSTRLLLSHKLRIGCWVMSSLFRSVCVVWCWCCVYCFHVAACLPGCLPFFSLFYNIISQWWHFLFSHSIAIRTHAHTHSRAEHLKSAIGRAIFVTPMNSYVVARVSDALILLICVLLMSREHAASSCSCTLYLIHDIYEHNRQWLN